MQQWSNCPRCNQFIQYGQPQCHYCGQQIDWGWRPPVEDRGQNATADTPLNGATGRTRGPKVAIIVCSIIGGILLLAVGVIVLANSPATSTPSNQVASKLNVTPGESAYILGLMDAGGKIANAMASIGEISQSPKIGDAAWEATLSGRLSTLKNYIEQAKTLSPPQSMRHINDKYLEGLGHFSSAIDLIDQGLKTRNMGMLNSGMAEMNLGAAGIGDAGTLLTEFTESHKK